MIAQWRPFGLAIGGLLAVACLLGLLLLLPSPIGITGRATSQVGNLSAGVATYISCTWSNEALAVSFGTSLNPGTSDYNGTQNYASAGNGSAYNVTVDTLSNVAANITIRGTNLTSGSNTIAAGNVSWQSDTIAANGTNMAPGNSTALTTAFSAAAPVAANEPVGSAVWFRFWLDIPAGQVAGSYAGTYTMQCQEA